MLITGRSKSKGFYLSVLSVSRSKQGQSKSEFALFSDWLNPDLYHECHNPYRMTKQTIIFFSEGGGGRGERGDGEQGLKSSSELEITMIESRVYRLESETAKT